MNIPKHFESKIIRTFCDKGKEWLESIDGIVNQCKIKWNLTNLELSDNLSYNLIFFAESQTYGDVVLKIGVLTNEIDTEIRSLSLYNGSHVCKLYDYDKKLGALLLERIVPGEDLYTISNSKERINIAADIISKLPSEVDKRTSLPEYTDWTSKAFTRAKQENIVGDKMLHLINEAETLFEELNYKKSEKVLLHGDLHHENILKGKNNAWKVIDPKGVIGIRCLESGRFILNEIEEAPGDNALGHIEIMISIIAERINEPKKIIAISAFIDSVLSTCWHFEDNSEQHEIEQAIKKCDQYLHYIKNL